MDLTPTAAADAAASAFDAWAATGPSARRALLNRAADEIEGSADEFVQLMGDELRASEPWARFNVMLGAATVREAAALTTQVGGAVIPSDKPGMLSLALREPAGVVLGIAPWNAPVILGCRAIATPLACGNTVVLKASERCPRTHGLIVDSFHAAGFPSGVVNLVTNAPADAAEAVGALIDHPAVRRINFTGSTAIGRMVAQRATAQLKPVLLELGGKAPLIVLDDADLEEAVKAAAFGAFMNAGQICMATERIIVVAAIADEFVRKLAAKGAAMPVAAIGAQVDDEAAASVEALVADALGRGAKRITGGAAIVLDRLTPEMKLYRDESFGPVVGIVRVADEDEAVRVANDSDYGLSAAVFSRDVARGLRVARRVRSGICHVNGPTVHDEPQMPFGGLGGSGYGRFGGQAGIDAFTELRWITISGEPGQFPI